MRAALVAALLLLLTAAADAASSPAFCTRTLDHGAATQDRVLQVASRLRQVLDAQPGSAALLARAGTQLGRFGVRYTHAAVALRDNPLAPWGVRQLYFACDEGRSRLFDQGLSGFLLGADRAESGFASLLLLPPEAADPLARATLDTPAAQALLAAEYLATAHPQDALRQNCNQWVAELLAQAWAPGIADRPAAQVQLARWDYAPRPVRYGSAFWAVATVFVPWVGFAGHPPADRERNEIVTSLPPDLDALAGRLWPQAQRVELCYTPEHLLIRRGGAPLPDDCQPAEGDELHRFSAH